MSQNLYIRLFLSVMLVVLLMVALNCNEDSDSPAEPSEAISLTVTDHSDCKMFTAKSYGVSASEECIVWEYDDEGLLSIQHINSGFNCCVDALLASFDKAGNTITIIESEDLENGGCDCLCLYDIDYRISYLAPSTYKFIIIAPCMDTPTTPDSDYITFSINLASEPSGSYCVERDYYPWGIE